MDPLDRINIDADSTFVLALEAQRRKHALFHYLPTELALIDGRVMARVRELKVRRKHGDYFTLGSPELVDLATMDVVLMRQDPPFDIGYITATYLLERVARDTLIVNDPRSVRDAPEKLFVLDFAEFMPPTMISRSLAEIREFHEKHGEIVVKPLHGKAGEGVFRIGRDGTNLTALAELFGSIWKEPFIVQAFLPSVTEGDKRIVLVDGEVAGAINRRPKSGEFRSNLAAGGTAERTELTAREQEICAAIGPELKRRGLLFVGIDVIGGMMTEINVTSPTGIVAIDHFNDSDTPALIWDAIEAKVSAR